jgi:hypothetical protein
LWILWQLLVAATRTALQMQTGQQQQQQNAQQCLLLLLGAAMLSC